MLLACLIVFSAMLAGAAPAGAAEAVFAWDAAFPVPDSYMLFQRIKGQDYDFDNPVWTGTETSCTVENLSEDTYYSFAVRAFSGNKESEDSNEVDFYLASNTGTTQFSVFASAGPNGTITPTGDVGVPHGDSTTFAIMPDTGYHIADVIVDGISLGAKTSHTFTQVGADHTISAAFALTQHMITATAGANGSISPAGSTSVSHGGDQRFGITAKTGYHVTDVKVDGVSVGTVSNYQFTDVTHPHTIQAEFSHANQAPLADAGHNQTVVAGTQVVLDGSGSSDPEGRQLTYAWVQTDGPSVQLIAAENALTSFIAPQVQNGAGMTLIFELTVIDDGALTSIDTCLVLVNPKLPVDSDSDGLADDKDAFPYDSGEQLDTDHDGIGNNADTDDDGDAMDDAWEKQHGLNPLVDDAAADPDGDGRSNLQEYQAGTDPSVDDHNQQQPDPPMILSPINGESGLPRRPKLQASPYSEPDTDNRHYASEWRIISPSNEKVVFQGKRYFWKTRLNVPIFVLDKFTTYTCQVRYFNQKMNASEWSRPITFTTGSKHFSYTNADGINDTKEPTRIQSAITLDGQYSTAVEIRAEEDTATIEEVQSVAPSQEEAMPPDLEALHPMGLIAYRIKVEEPGATVAVQLDYSDPVAPETSWVVLNADGQWIDGTEKISTMDKGTSVVRELTDGGPEDLDGVANGTIVDLMGPMASTNQTTSELQPDSRKSTSALPEEVLGMSCFINTLLD
ncbi:MAG: fibronectin type III domain-containing protein [Desulfatitalea sp.]|nr:hypothetical protein [Desulfatitalea sp.]NNJ99680.1 fibronectin type III domain-containing protein [Desulfatitalea sp.]